MSGEILNYDPSGKMAEAVRRMSKWGLNLFDYVPGADGVVPYREDTRLGFGNAETVASWIGTKFATLSEAQTAYPIIQSTSDTLDWVLLQTAIDDAIYGALGNSNKGRTKRKLKIPAGLYICNRPLHIGYARAGTPPASLNGNGYVTITIEGEGATVDSSGNGMTGVTIRFTSQVGIVCHGYQRVMVRGIAVVGPWLSFYSTNSSAILNSSTVGAPASWKPTGIADENWAGGAAVSIGIGVDLYTTDASAAAYPARPLPAAFGGGTTTEKFSTAGGTSFICEDVIIAGFVLGFGRPHGDSNGEFLEINGGVVTMCAYPFVNGHSQARNLCIRNTNFYVFHTMMGSRGGLTGIANLHGSYDNIHAGYGYQIIDHPSADWSGAMTIRDLYAEGVFRIGRWANTLKLDGCYISFYEQDGNFGVAENHYDVKHLVLAGGEYTGLRHGLVSAVGDVTNSIELTNAVDIRVGFSANWANHANATKIGHGLDYMGGVLHFPGYNQRRFFSDAWKSRYGKNGDQLFYYDAVGMTYLDQEFVQFTAIHPFIYSQVGTTSTQMVGSAHTFAVPKITQYGVVVGYISRSGLDIVCGRTAVGDIKADIGDYFMIKPEGATESLRVNTWFVVTEVTDTTMTLRQQTNYFGSSQYAYSANQNYQITPSESVTQGTSQYFCTRIRQNKALWVGDVEAGSNVITNVKNALAYGSADDFTAGNCLMAVGDYFLHHELDRANTGGAGLKVHNKITAIDYTANSITLTDNFNIDRTNYPLPFFVKMYTA